MDNWFKSKVVSNASDRTIGFLIRLFGIDFSMVAMGWIQDWKIIDIRIPVNYGIYLQLGFFLLAIGRLPTDAYEDN